jgi:hypothetical protein
VIKFIIMKRFVLFFIPIFLIAFSCGSDAKKTSTEKEVYEKTKESLKAREEKNPQNFLFVDGHDKRNLFGQTVIKGSLTNKASIAVFKDVDISLLFYSKTHALLETDKETVFEVLHPGESKSFKTKYFPPKGTDSVALSVSGAKVVKE